MRCSQDSAFQTSFSPSALLSRRPLSSTGSRGSVPRLQRYYGALRFPAARHGALRSPSRAAYADVPNVCSRRLRALRLWAGTLWSAGALSTGVHCETTGPPRFLGGPRCAYALLYDPGRADTPGHYNVPILPPPPCKTTAPTSSFFRGSITRPSHSLSTLRSAPRETPRKTRFRLVASLCPAGFGPAGSPTEGFKLLYFYITLLLHQA